MALVTTPGAANADSYVTLAEFNTYCDLTGRGVSGADNEVEVLLRKALAYLENQYRGRWVGYRATEAQSLAWPRLGTGGDRFRYAGDSFAVYGIIDEDGFQIATDTVPVQIKNAQCEAAILINAGATLQPTVGPQVKSETVGPISVTYVDGASLVDRYMAVEGILRGLVKSTPGSNSGNVTLVRA